MSWLAAVIFIIIFLALFGIFLFFAVNLFFAVLTRNCLYIGTSRKIIDRILKEAELKEGQYVLELDCGDGRVLRRAAREYEISGKGIDLHGWAILKAKILAARRKTKNIKFERGDIFETDFAQADVIYLFLTREILVKLAPQLKSKIKPDALLISHGFELPEFEKWLFKTIEHDGDLPEYQKKTFFYKFKIQKAKFKS